MPAFEPDLIETVQGVMTQQMLCNSAAPGETNLEVVTATAATDIDTIHIDLSMQLWAKNTFSKYGPITYAYLGDEVVAPHQFTFAVGDFRNDGAPKPTEP
jgi:hypothetical protein